MTAEWLEADGTGGFASGTVNTIRTRRYHGLLLVATTPPTGRVMLVNGHDGWLETPDGRIDLTAQRYDGNVIYPEGHRVISAFVREPWPTWTYALPDGNALTLEVLATPPAQRTILRWTLARRQAGITLHVRPLISGRDYHSLQHENAACNLSTWRRNGGLQWHPYPDLPVICNATNAEWVDDPRWYRNFHYTLERARGLDDREDLVSPGKMRWDLSSDQAVWIVGTEPAVSSLAASTDLLGEAETIVRGERSRRGKFADPLARGADAYLVQRGVGKTIVAGYPWFTDWGRDTFIALRGLCLTTRRWREAGDILLEWASTVSEGMLPNRFPDGADPPEYNAVDASLWYIIASSELLALTASGDILSAHDRQRLESVMLSVLEGLARGTRYGIRCDTDGLLACGVAGVQLTWMDARVGDRVITPRIGKPVEIQALWINALAVGARLSSRWPPILEHARQSFNERFWNEATGCLLDVIDVDHLAGATDDSIRPNQIFAVGGLPIPVLDGIRARRVVDAVESHLLTPLGLRTLSPQSSAYIGRYEGNPSSRDAAYHQGTAWPWLMGAFVDAWIRTHGDEPGLIEEARTRFLGPLIAHLEDAGLGHVSEIVDGDPPHAPRGCPFQAWSLGELMRIRQALTGVERA